MKYFSLIALIFTVCVFFSCKKHDNPEKIKTPFEFTRLNASNTTPARGEIITVDAVAKGDNLKYTWFDHEEGYDVPLGTLVVLSDGHVQWSACHGSTFIIKCKVEDMYGNQKEDSVYIYTQREK